MTINEIKAYRDPSCPASVKNQLVSKTIKKQEMLIYKIAKRNYELDSDFEAIVSDLKIFIWECFETIVKPERMVKIQPDTEIAHFFLKKWAGHFLKRNKYQVRTTSKQKDFERKSSIITDDFSYFKSKDYNQVNEEYKNLETFTKSLSERQKTIVKGLYQRKPYKEIGKDINMTGTTVKNELKKIKRKFDLTLSY